MKGKALAVVIIIFAAIFLVSLISGAMLAVRFIGWAEFGSATQLREKIQSLIGDFQWPAIIHAGRQTIDLDELRISDLMGVSEIKITAISEKMTVTTGGTQVEARMRGSYVTLGKALEWKMERQGGILTIYAVYPRMGMILNNLSIDVQIPAEYTGIVRIGTISGSCLLPGEMDRSWAALHFKGVSGSLKVDRATMPSSSIIQVSGDVDLSGCAGRVDAESVSGKIGIVWDSFAGASLKTVSGKVHIALPETAGAEINFTTVSGSFTIDDLQISITSQQKRKLAAKMNNGEFPLTVSTVSGDLAISRSQP